MYWSHYLQKIKVHNHLELIVLLNPSNSASCTLSYTRNICFDPLELLVKGNEENLYRSHSSCHTSRIFSE